MMELFAALQTRTSAARLAEPGPALEDLDRLLQAAVRAPDHGRLRPWRLIVLEGAVRESFTAAAGAAAQNLFLAAHDLGYGVMWKTGAAAYDPAVKATVGLRPDDHIVAIM